MKLITPRLEIRLAEFGEGAKLAQYYVENREFLQPFYPKFTPEDFDQRAWESTLPHVRSEFDARRSIRLCLFHQGRVCGVANVTNATQSPRFSATLGYSLGQTFQGMGLMREALSEIIPFAFSRLRLHRLEANYMPRNERSGRTLEALGFLKEGLAHQYLLINGVWEDHILTAKINPNWQ
jgi:ribosomal-protein-alanine N-acetyltransferase